MKPLAGWRVLVPRGGKWGDNVASVLRGHGAVPVIAQRRDFFDHLTVADIDPARAQRAPAAAVQLGEVGAEPLLAWLVVAVGDHYKYSLAVEVAG